MKLKNILIALGAIVTLGLSSCVATGSAAGSTTHSGSISGSGMVR